MRLKAHGPGVKTVARMVVPPERLWGRGHAHSPQLEAKGRLLHRARHVGLRARLLEGQLPRCGRQPACVQRIAAASAAGCSARTRRHAHEDEEEESDSATAG